MSSYNNVTLVGRLTRDPELRYGPSGIAITKFSVAVDRKFKNKETGEKVTDFFECSVFRQTAEYVSNYIKKGKLVLVSGSIEINDGQDREGNSRKYVNIVCENVTQLERGDDGQDGQAPAPAARKPQAQNSGEEQPARKAQGAKPSTPAPAPVAAAVADDEDFGEDDPFNDD